MSETHCLSSITSGIMLLLYKWTTVERRCRITGFSGRMVAPQRAARLLLLESRSVPASKAPHPLE
jgi:hypothetical protein